MLEFGLIFLSLSVAMNVTFSFHVWGVFDEFLCVTVETTASCGRSDGENVKVLFPWHLVFEGGGVADDLATQVLAGWFRG